MSRESVSMVADGREFVGWTRVTVVAKLFAATRAFQIEVTEVPTSDPKMQAAAFFSKWHFPPFTKVDLLAGGSLLLTGYVDNYQPMMGPENHRVTIIGRGTGSLIVDSSADHETGQFEDKTVLDIFKELAAPTGVKVSEKGSRGTGGPVNFFRIRQGSTIHAEMMRLVQPRFATLMGEADGGVAIVTGVLGNHPGQLAQGKNIEQMSANISGGSRYAEYKDRAQDDGTDFEEDIQEEGVATDPLVPLKKTKIIIHPAAPFGKRNLQQRATWEAARAAGFSTQADLVVDSWRDEAGKLWEPGFTVWVYAPALKIDQSMLIETAQFQQDDQGGTVTALTLINPQAIGGDQGATGSGDMWKLPDLFTGDKDAGEPGPNIFDEGKDPGGAR